MLEAGSHIGGHADTVDVTTTGGTIPVDMGFIVYNDLTYPHMIRLFGEYGDLYAFLIFTPLLLTLGEIVPKSVYQQNANRIAPVVIFPLRLFRLLLYPVIAIFSLFARLAARLGGGEQLFGLRGVALLDLGLLELPCEWRQHRIGLSDLQPDVPVDAHEAR